MKICLKLPNQDQMDLFEQNLTKTRTLSRIIPKVDFSFQNSFNSMKLDFVISGYKCRITRKMIINWSGEIHTFRRLPFNF